MGTACAQQGTAKDARVEHTGMVIEMLEFGARRAMLWVALGWGRGDGENFS